MNPKHVIRDSGDASAKLALRPYPQWGGIPPFLGPPLGVTW
jgi:hypothetical protein